MATHNKDYSVVKTSGSSIDLNGGFFYAHNSQKPLQISRLPILNASPETTIPKTFNPIDPPPKVRRYHAPKDFLFKLNG